jgi:hypothetical protein
LTLTDQAGEKVTADREAEMARPSLPSPAEDDPPDEELYREIHAGHWGEVEKRPDGSRIQKWVFTDPRHPSYTAPSSAATEDTQRAAGPIPPPAASNVVSIDTARQKYRNIPEIVIIRANAREWKNSIYGLPYPPDHKLIPHGGRGRGKQTSAGYQIIRKAVCVECGKEKTVTAGYINGRKTKVAKGEIRNVKVEIIRYILKRRSANTDRKLERLRCNGCSARSQGRSDSASQV